jgi:hypothetical protein
MDFGGISFGGEGGGGGGGLSKAFLIANARNDAG